jgi:hypothetical protein
MNRNMTWPSGCCQRLAATMKARPAALSMISTDISMKIRLRRAMTPTRPMAKSAAARTIP